MSLACPHCQRSQPDAAGVAFCMFCGHRLAAEDADETRALLPPVEKEPDTAPTRIGTYRLVRKLGSGGMGTVYEAESSDGGARVAVKLLSAKLAGNPTSVERFRQEGRLASQMSHPRCVFVYGADTDAGRPFIVMELMPGSTLKDLVERRGPLPPGEAVARILDVIDGLIEAHRLGLIHRDVKPSNCFLTHDDRVKIGDFGLSKSLGGNPADGQLTNSGAFLGTVLFAPPEQIRGEEVGYDSDIYAVSATLYYALTGQAPYQHASLTAALAKAISEPPPRIRARRPEVSRALERIVLRGMERDRNRRWGSLDELRDALAEQLPGRAVPARPRVRVAAFLLDAILLAFCVNLPIELVAYSLSGRVVGGVPALDLLPWLGWFAYFALAEGLTGTTFGKAMLRLRVVRDGGIGPPGLKQAAIRVLVFQFLWACILEISSLLSDIPVAGVPLAVALVLGGAAGLLVQLLNRRRDYRGLHDLASGCQIMQRPRPPHRVRLTPRGELTAKPAYPPLPATAGGFDVRGQLADLPDGGMVWLGEDPSLSRRVIFRVLPIEQVPDDPPPPPVRPTRLRSLGAADVTWNGRAYAAAAYAAPTGGPIPDLVRPANPLPWADARFLIEQLVEELRAGNVDGTRPARLGLDQLWAEPSGRLHLLDFPLPTNAPIPPPAESELWFVAQLATLLLEGRGRATARPLAAPLPPHAMHAVARLFKHATPFASLDELQTALAETHAHPPRATGTMRAVQLGLMGLIGSFALALMLLVPLGLPFGAAFIADQQASSVEMILAGLEDPETRASWQAAGHIEPARIDAAKPLLRDFAAIERRSQERLKLVLTRPESWLLHRMHAESRDLETIRRLPPSPAGEMVRYTELVGRREMEPFGSQPHFLSALVEVTMGLGVGSFLACAFAFRGGLAYMLAGLALVRRSGRPAGRFQCAFREAMLWLPLAAVLAGGTWLQLLWPESFAVRVGFGLVTLVVLLLGVGVAIRFPARGPHDRLAGTYVVPV